MFVLASTPGKSGTLLDADVVHPSAGLKIVATGLVADGDIANGETYPPANPLSPLPSAYDRPTLVGIAVEAGEPGTYDGLGVVLRWERGGEEHVSYQPLGFRLCVGATTCAGSPVIRKVMGLDVDDVLAEYAPGG